MLNSFSLKCFGVGDGWPCADRNHSAYLYRFGEVSVLIDCGEPANSRVKATGLSYEVIDRIFLSHMHCDHIGGLFMLLQGCWLEQRRKHLTVILPAEGIEPIRHFLKSIYLFDELFAFRLSLEPLKAGQPVAAGHVRVTPFLTSHLSSLRQAFQRKYGQAFEAYCFLLEADSLRIGHSADIGSPHDLAPLLEKPLDLLVCELAHAIPEDLFNYLRDQPIKRILFVHLAGKLWEDITELQALAAEKLGGISFSFARDSEEIAL